MAEAARTKRVYYLVTALNWFATVLPMAVMVLLAQSRGMSLAEIGLFMGAYSLTVVILEVPSGALADAVGRKRTFIAGGAVNVLARVVFLFAFDLWSFAAFALLLGLGRALTSGALEAWFVDALQEADPDVDLQPALAGAGSFQLAGLALGTVVGGALPALFAWLPTEGALTPLSVPVLVSAVVQVAVLAAVALLVVERRAGHGSTALRRALSPSSVAGLVRQALRTALRSPTLRLLLVADVAVGASVAASENMWQPFFAALLPGQNEAELAAGGGTLALGALLGGSFGVGILGNLVATRLSRALGKRHALTAAVFQGVQGAALIALALRWGFAPAAALFLGSYLARAGWGSPHMTLYNREVDARSRSVMLSLQSLCAFFGAFVGSVAFGAVAEATSIGTAWACSGALVAATGLVYLRLELLTRPVTAFTNGPVASGGRERT